MPKYIRKPEVVLQHLKTTSTGQVITQKACKIQVPARFMDVGLGQIGSETYVMGYFALILDTHEYAVCSIAAIVELNPFKTITVMIDDILYYEFYFEPGDVVIKTTDVVRRSNLMYNIFDEFIFKGKVPWYLEYEDLGKLFDTAKSHGDSNVGESLETIEFITSIISRHIDDRTQPVRLAVKEYKDITKDSVQYVGMNSVFYSVNSTMNRLTGSYFNDGIVSSMVIPTDKVSTIESILRA